MHARSTQLSPAVPLVKASLFAAALISLLALTGCASDNASQAGADRGATSQADGNQDRTSQQSDSAQAGEAKAGEAKAGEAKAGEAKAGEATANAKPTAKDLRWNRTDLKFIYQGLSKQLHASDLIEKWHRQAAAGDAPAIGLVAFRNHVTPELSPSIDAVASALETSLVNDTDSKVISTDLHYAALKKALDKYPDDKHLAALSEFGRTINIEYVVTGVVTSDVKPQPPAERVNYSVLMHVIDVSSEKVVFQADFEMTKPRQ